MVPTALSHTYTEKKGRKEARVRKKDLRNPLSFSFFSLSFVTRRNFCSEFAWIRPAAHAGGGGDAPSRSANSQICKE